MAKNNKVIISRAGRMPIVNRPIVLNSDNMPRAVVQAVTNPLARKPR